MAWTKYWLTAVSSPVRTSLSSSRTPGSPRMAGTLLPRLRRRGDREAGREPPDELLDGRHAPPAPRARAAGLLDRSEGRRAAFDVGHDLAIGDPPARTQDGHRDVVRMA